MANMRKLRVMRSGYPRSRFREAFGKIVTICPVMTHHYDQSLVTSAAIGIMDWFYGAGRVCPGAGAK